jgi:hypothetical protein
MDSEDNSSNKSSSGLSILIMTFTKLFFYLMIITLQSGATFIVIYLIFQWHFLLIPLSFINFTHLNEFYLIPMIFGISYISCIIHAVSTEILLKDNIKISLTVLKFTNKIYLAIAIITVILYILSIYFNLNELLLFNVNAFALYGLYWSIFGYAFLIGLFLALTKSTNRQDEFIIWCITGKTIEQGISRLFWLMLLVFLLGFLILGMIYLSHSLYPTTISNLIFNDFWKFIEIIYFFPGPIYFALAATLQVDNRSIRYVKTVFNNPDSFFEHELVGNLIDVSNEYKITIRLLVWRLNQIKSNSQQ